MHMCMQRERERERERGGGGGRQGGREGEIDVHVLSAYVLAIIYIIICVGFNSYCEIIAINILCTLKIFTSTHHSNFLYSKATSNTV